MWKSFFALSKYHSHQSDKVEYGLFNFIVKGFIYGMHK